MTAEKLEQQLAEIVGADNVIPKEIAQQNYAHDQYWYAIAAANAGEPLSRPDVAVRPKNTKEVAAIVKLANKIDVPITPWGGGSGVQGAANADEGGIVMDLRAMNAIRSIDKKSLICVVEAGKNVKEFEEELNQSELAFTHYPASAEWATIGGCVAARGSGVLSTKYGKIEEHILSVEFVTPTGDIVQTPNVPRHAAGPEITQLHVGAEGVFGIVTAVTVKLQFMPKARQFAVFAFDNLKDGIEAGRQIMTTGLKPPVIRLYDVHGASTSLARATETEFTTPIMVMMFDGYYPEMVKIETEVASRICQAQNGTELSPSIGDMWWNKRYAFYHPPFSPQLPSIWGTVDVVSTFDCIEAVYDMTTQAIRDAAPPEYKVSLNTHFSHWYEWGTMIYARMKVEKGPDNLTEAKALHDQIFYAGLEAALAAGAVMNDHHGVGLRLAPYMNAQYGAGMTMLKQIKHGLDPKNILCPGKLGLPKR